MTGSELADRAESIAENSFLKLIGRLGMASAFPILVAGTAWLGSTIWAINSEQAKLTGRIDVLSERIGASVIRQSDVELGFKIRDQRIEYMERSVNEHGQRIYRLEQR